MKKIFAIQASRRQFLLTSTAATVACGLGLRTCINVDRKPSFDSLAQVGDNFTFALVADPQVAHMNTKLRIHKASERKLSEIIEELNQIQPKLPFVIFNGDLVESAISDHISNFLDRVKLLNTLPILVHGNHDGLFPYREFKQMQKECNGTEHTAFSFNCGRWHFVILPCNFENSPQFATQLLNWLDQDLSDHQRRPTMVFEHYHLLPQGLTQLQWYSYNRAFKQQLIEQLAKHKNVRYVICGHVHNGIRTSVKTAWTYRGINFITAPTCTASRNFGEEYAKFLSTGQKLAKGCQEGVS